MRARILCIVEVVVVFGLVVGLFRFVQSIPLKLPFPGAFAGLMPSYVVLLTVSFLLYISRCSLWPPQGWREKLKFQGGIIASGFFPVFVLSVLLNWLSWNHRFEAILIFVIEIGLLTWFAWASKGQAVSERRGFFGGLLLIGMVSSMWPVLREIALAILYFYLFVGFGEELLFRGYIQSRLNTVFGRPKQFMGIAWGWGLIIAAMLFGLWHLNGLLNMHNWPQVLWTIGGGLIFGLVREKGESVIAPAILHGVLNYGPQAIVVTLVWNQ